MNLIKTLHLFPKLTEELLKLLRGLKAADWLKPSSLDGQQINWIETVRFGNRNELKKNHEDTIRNKARN